MILCVLVTQSRLTLCDPIGCSPPGFSVRGIPQARILEWVAIPFFRGSSGCRDRTWVWKISCTAGRFFTVWATREVYDIREGKKSFSFYSLRFSAPHSSTLAWKVPWMEEPDRLQSMGSLRVGHDWATSLSLSLFTFTFHFHFSLSYIGERNGNPLLCSCLEDPKDGGAWWAAIYGVAQSRAWLKWLSSSSSSS